MSNNNKIIQGNQNRHFGFHSSLFIPSLNEIENTKEENFDENNELLIFKNKIESSNNLKSNQAQIKSHMSNTNLKSLLSEDLIRRIDDCSPLNSAEVNKFNFIEFKIPSKALFLEEAQNLNSNDESNKFSNKIFESNNNYSKEKLDKISSCFINNPFFSINSEDYKNSQIANLINETEDDFKNLNYWEINNLNIKKEEENKAFSEEILFSKLFESLHPNPEYGLEGEDPIISDLQNKNFSQKNSHSENEINLKNFGELLDSTINNEENQKFKHEEENFGNSENNSNLNSNLPKNININNNFNYNIINNFPYQYYYNYLVRINPYLVNAGFLFKLNYVFQLHNYFMNNKLSPKTKSSTFQYGKAGWTCMYCSNFNYEIRIKCNRCGKLPANKMDLPKKEEKKNIINSQNHNSKIFTNSSNLNKNIVELSNNKNNSLPNQISSLQNDTKIRILDTNSKLTIINKNSNEKCYRENFNGNKNMINERFLNVNNDTNFKKTELQENNFIKNSQKTSFLTINNLSNAPSSTRNYNNSNPFPQSFNTAYDNFPNFNNIQQNNQSKIYSNINKNLNKFSNPENINVVHSNNENEYYYVANSNLLEPNFFHTHSKNEMKSINPVDNQILLKQMNSLKINNSNKTNPVNNRYEINNLTSNFQNCRTQGSQLINDRFNNPILLNNLNGNSNINFNEKVNNIKTIPDLQNDKKKKKPFVERVGDWVCLQCKNLNFSFRTECNRCQLSKFENQNLIDVNKKR